METQAESKNDKGEKSFLATWATWAFTGWGLDEKELREEVEQYDTLPWGKSSRKTAAAIWAFFALFTLIVGFFFPSVVVERLDLAIALIFIPLIYKGWRWALVLAAIFWLLQQGWKIAVMLSGDQINFLGLFFIFIFTIIMLKALYAAFIVEQARKKLRK